MEDNLKSDIAFLKLVKLCFYFSLGYQEFYCQLRILITCIEKLLFLHCSPEWVKTDYRHQLLLLNYKKKVSDFILCIYPQYDKITWKGDLWMNKNDIISQEENELDYF